LGVKYVLIVLRVEGGGNIGHVSLLTSLLVRSQINQDFLSWLRQYQIEIFVLLKQCYYCANNFIKFCVAWPISPPPNLLGLTVQSYDGCYTLITSRFCYAFSYSFTSFSGLRSVGIRVTDPAPSVFIQKKIRFGSEHKSVKNCFSRVGSESILSGAETLVRINGLIDVAGMDYCLSKKSWPILYSNLHYIIGQDSIILTILNSSKTVKTNRHHEVGIEVVLKSCLWLYQKEFK